MQKDAQSPASDLEDMQSLLFLTEDGDSHNRSGRLAMALKRYVAVQKVRDMCSYRRSKAEVLCQTFNEFEDDQYDFHGYSLRKFTINIYMKYSDSSLSLSCAQQLNTVLYHGRIEPDRTLPTYMLQLKRHASLFVFTTTLR